MAQWAGKALLKIGLKHDLRMCSWGWINILILLL
jgi:hypothetical protein